MKHKNIKSFVANNQEQIMRYSGVGLLLGAIPVTARNHRKAMDLLYSEAMEEKPTKEKIKKIWKYYVPTGLMVTTGLGLISSAEYTEFVGKTAITAATIAAEKTVETVYETVKEELGDDAVDKVKEKVHEEHLKSKGYKRAEDDRIFVNSSGAEKVRFVTAWSDKEFMSTTIDVDRAFNELNNLCIRENKVNINDLHYLLGINTITLGDRYIWEAGETIEYRKNPILDDNDNLAIELELLTEPHIE